MLSTESFKDFRINQCTDAGLMQEMKNFSRIEWKKLECLLNCVREVLSEFSIYFNDETYHPASFCGSVGKDCVYHACGDEFESRLK